MPDTATVERKQTAAGILLVKIARDEELRCDDLRKTLERLEEALEEQPRLTEDDLNLRAGF